MSPPHPPASGAGTPRDESPSERIHVLVDGPRDPAWNMAVDNALLDLRQRGDLSGTWVRLYGWAPPAVSIGRLQGAEEELDFGALRSACVPVVRRATGGKAVYHANELTYSLVGGVPDPTWGGNLQETYRRVTAVLIAALLRIGVATALAPRRGGRGGERAAAGENNGALAAACFAVAYGHELVHAGRKVCGSAQRRLTRAFLQHGSLLLGPEQAQLGYFLRLDGDREAVAEKLALETTDVSTAAGMPVPAVEVARSVVAALREAYGARVVTAQLPPPVAALAARLRGSVMVDLDAEPRAVDSVSAAGYRSRSESVTPPHCAENKP